MHLLTNIARWDSQSARVFTQSARAFTLATMDRDRRVSCESLVAYLSVRMFPQATMDRDVRVSCDAFSSSSRPGSRQPLLETWTQRHYNTVGGHTMCEPDTHYVHIHAWTLTRMHTYIHISYACTQLHTNVMHACTHTHAHTHNNNKNNAHTKYTCTQT